jgi:hypothetical protein
MEDADYFALIKYPFKFESNKKIDTPPHILKIRALPQTSSPNFSQIKIGLDFDFISPLK